MDPKQTANNWTTKWNQTADLTIPEDKNCYVVPEGSWDKGNGTWVLYSEGGVSTPDEPETQPATDPVVADGYVYLKNSANWSKVYMYQWTNYDGNAEPWPGNALESVGDGYFRTPYLENMEFAIFNNGSGTQTADLTYPAKKNLIFDNKDMKWLDEPFVPEEPTEATDPTEEPTVAPGPSEYALVGTMNNWDATANVLNYYGPKDLVKTEL